MWESKSNMLVREGSSKEKIRMFIGFNMEWKEGRKPRRTVKEKCWI